MIKNIFKNKSFGSILTLSALALALSMPGVALAKKTAAEKNVKAARKAGATGPAANQSDKAEDYLKGKGYKQGSDGVYRKP